MFTHTVHTTGIIENTAVVLHVLLEDLYLTYYIPVVLT